MERLGIHEAPIQKERPQKNFENRVAYEDWVIRNELPLYPEEHPVTGYVRSLFNKLTSPTDSRNFNITVYKGEPNAFCLPNGSIYVSDKLVDLTDSEEELLFALGHEKSHVTEEHARKRVESSTRRSPGSIINEALRHFGQARFHEWEADLRAFNTLESLGINPMAGIDLFEKFRQLSRGRSDITHGKNTDRVLNLRMMTHMQDVTTIQEPFHPIPEEIRTRLERENFISYYDFFLKNFRDRDVPNIERALRNLSGASAILILPEAIKMNKLQRESTSENAKRWSDYQRQVITSLGQKVWENISEVFDPDTQTRLSDQQKSFLFHSVLEFVGGCDTTSEESIGLLLHPDIKTHNTTDGQQAKWDKSKVNLQEQLYSDEDVDEFLTTLSPELFTKLGVKFTAKPDNLIKNTAKRVLEQEIYTDDEGKLNTNSYIDFARSLADRVSELYKAHGTLDAKSPELFTSIIEVAEKSLPEDEFTQLKKEAVANHPEVASVLREREAIEQKPEIRLFNIFQKHLKEIDIVLAKNQDDRGGMGARGGLYQVWQKTDRERQDVTRTFESETNELLDSLHFENQHQALSVLANFRNRLMEDPDLWDIYELRGNIHSRWSSIVYNHFTKKYLAPESENTIDGLLFKTKVALLLESDAVVLTGSKLHDLPNNFAKLLQNPSFTISDYAKVYNLAKPASLEKELACPVRTADLFHVDSRSSTWPTILKEGIYHLMDRCLKASPKKENFSPLLTQLTTDFPFDHYGHDFIVDVDQGVAKNQGPLKNRILERVFNKYKFDIKNPNDLISLYYLSTYFEDTSSSVRLQNFTIERLAEQLPFDEGLNFLHTEVKNGRLLSLHAVQNYIEQSAKTHQEIRRSKDVMIELLSSGAGNEELGKLIAVEEFADLLFQKNKPEFLIACIGNEKNDELLKRYLYKRWVSTYNASSFAAEVINLNTIMQKLYSLDAQKKYILIRDLLTGNNGVLTGKDRDRAELVDFFIDNYVEAKDDFEKGMRSVVRDVMKEMILTANYDLTYFALSRLLQNRLLVPPRESVSWKEVAATEVPPIEFDSQLRMSVDGDTLRPTEESLNTISFFLNGSRQDQTLKDSDKSRLNYEKKVEKLIGSDNTQEKLKLSVTEFISEIAQTLGAPGVRFLQLIGQYIELPPHLEQEFRNVYDKVEGQSKITADKTLLREWPQGEHAIDGLTERLGGGSLMSVFQAQHNEGNQRAIKILNPNSAFHTETTYQLLTQVFTKLAARDSQFTPALTVLDDIRDWIRGDIDFTGFLETDSRFRQKHDGFSVGGRYKIKVPVSYPPENKFFAQEDFIDGINLTNMEALSAQGHDLREVMSLVSKNFLEQVKGGLVHSDIHPGNIRVTPNDEVAYLDRNFYIPLTIQDRIFLAGLTQKLGTDTDAVDHCLSYLKSQGAEIGEEKRTRIIEQASSLNTVPDSTDRLLGLTVMLREEGLRFPLKITLLVKDFFYLDRLSKRVGFAGITEAIQA